VKLIWWPVAIGAAVGVGIGLCSPYLYSVVVTVRALVQPKPANEADWMA
jgi:hypothetical protein